MGFFSNRYTKEGPGVSKNEPEKIGFIKFFELYFRSFWKLCTGNLLYFLLSIPILTVGLSEVGLAYVTRATARNTQTFVSSDFFDTIKKNWKQALIIGIIDLILTGVLIFNIFFSWNSQGTFGIIMLGATVAVFVLFTFSKYYHYMMTITFNMSVWKIFKTSFIFSMLGIWRNLLISLGLLICYAIAFCLCWFAGPLGITIAILLYMFLFPAFRSYLIQFNVFPTVRKYIIDPYYKDHPDDDIQRRRDLGVYEEPEEEDENEEEEKPTCSDELII